MACAKDENLSPLMISILRAFQDNQEGILTEAELIQRTSSPAFRLRSSVRELIRAEFLMEEKEGYRLTSKGIRFLNEA